MKKRTTLDYNLVHGFCQQYLMQSFDDPQPTPDCHLEWWKIMCSSAKRVAIAAPRGHAKSTAISFVFVLACLLFRFRRYVLIISDTSGQAEEFLGDIRRELEENDELIAIFGITFPVGEKNNTTDLVVSMQPAGQPKPWLFRISARGSGKSLRGIKWRGMRPDLVVGDDLENDEMVESDERREKFRKWFNNALLQVGSKSCIFRLVGTILHFDSLLERRMPNPRDPDTVVEDIREYSTKTNRSWVSVKYRAHNPDFSEMLWPEQWPKERLMEERQNYIDDGAPEGYAQEYLNNPLAIENALFRKDDMIPFQDANNGSLWNYYCGVDLAISKADKAAYSVFSVIGFNHDGVARVFHVERGRWDSLELIDKFFEVHGMFNDITFFVEKENIARTLGPILYNEMDRRDEYLLMVDDLVPTKDKRQRSAAMQARVRARRVEFDHEAPWFHDLLTEFCQFDAGQFMDQVDACGIVFLAMNKTNEALTEEEWEEEEYEYDLEQSLADLDGRSRITGY